VSISSSFCKCSCCLTAQLSQCVLYLHAFGLARTQQLHYVTPSCHVLKELLLSVVWQL